LPFSGWRYSARGAAPAARRRCGGRSRQIAVVVAALSGGATLWFEWFFHRSCPLDAPTRSGTELMMRTNIRLLEDARLPYWADFGTLLQVLRNSGVNPWDPDSDFSTEYTGEAVVADLTERFERIKVEMGVPDATITYFEDR
jgi:hypothetical protein